MNKTHNKYKGRLKNARTLKKRWSKKINCSPEVKNKTINSSTCYTPEVLIKIKDEYNKSHSKDKYIPWSNPQEIWRTLNSRLVNCAKEDCWLSTIKDKQLAQELKDVIFAPEHPPEWLKNPNEWLTDLDIANVMKQYVKTYRFFKFIGPSPIDFDTRVERGKIPWANQGNNYEKICIWEELCHLNIEKLLNNGITQIGVIFNLDRYDEPGSHWVSLYVSLGEPHIAKKNGGGIADLSIMWPKNMAEPVGGNKYNKVYNTPFIFYFDSTGNEAPQEIKTLIKRIQTQCAKLTRPIKLKEFNNNGKDHQKSNTECGMYSLFFIITMLTNKIEDEQAHNGERVLDFNEKIALFRNAIIPDKYVENYRHKYFNKPK